MTTVPCNPAFGQDPAIGDGSDFTARRQAGRPAVV